MLVLTENKAFDGVTIWDQLVPSGNILDHLVPSGTMWARVVLYVGEPAKCLEKQIKPKKPILERSC